MVERAVRQGTSRTTQMSGRRTSQAAGAVVLAQSAVDCPTPSQASRSRGSTSRRDPTFRDRSSPAAIARFTVDRDNPDSVTQWATSMTGRARSRVIASAPDW